MATYAFSLKNPGFLCPSIYGRYPIRILFIQDYFSSFLVYVKKYLNIRILSGFISG